MTGSNVIDLRERLFRPFRMRAPVEGLEGIEVVHYQALFIHESVPVTTFVAALAAGGLAVSNVDGVGLVVHARGHDPATPDDGPDDAWR